MALNRTVVVPPFFKHDRTDKTIATNGNLVMPWDRIDFNAYAQLVSIVDPRHLNEICGPSFDAFLNTKKKFFGGTPSLRLKEVYEFTGMDSDTFPKIYRVGEDHPATNSHLGPFTMENMFPNTTKDLPSSGSIHVSTRKSLNFTFNYIRLASPRPRFETCGKQTLNARLFSSPTTRSIFAIFNMRRMKTLN